MSADLKVDDIATVINQVGVFAHLNGVEVVIIDPLESRRVYCHRTHTYLRLYCYGVRFSDGEEGYFRPEDLRKKRPPQQYSGELRIRELFDQSPVEQLVPAEIA